MNIAKFLRTPFFIEDLWWVLLDNEDSWGNEDFVDNSQNNESRNCTKKLKGRPRADSQGAKI